MLHRAIYSSLLRIVDRVNKWLCV